MNNIKASIITPSPTTIISKGDSATSNHYFPLWYIATLQDVVADKLGPSVFKPNTSTLTENATIKLPL